MRKLNKKWLFAISAIMVGSMAAVSGCGATEEPASVVESEAAVQTSCSGTGGVRTRGSGYDGNRDRNRDGDRDRNRDGDRDRSKNGDRNKEEPMTESQPQIAPSEQSEPAQEEAPAAEGAVTAGDYAVSIGGLRIPIGDDMRNYVGLLGEPDAYGAAKSCTEAGDDKVYTYGGTTIYTYITNGADIISLIEITGSDYLPSGIHVGSTKEEVIAAYGSAYTEEGTELLYEMGSKTIGLQMTDNKVSFIELFGQ